MLSNSARASLMVVGEPMQSLCLIIRDPKINPWSNIATTEEQKNASVCAENVY